MLVRGKRHSRPKLFILLLVVCSVIAGGFRGPDLPGPTVQRGATVSTAHSRRAVQRPDVEGVVTDKATGRPVDGALIEVLESSVASDIEGKFGLTFGDWGGATPVTGVSEPRVNFRISAEGYRPLEISGARIYKDDTLKLSVTLSRGDQVDAEIHRASAPDKSTLQNSVSPGLSDPGNIKIASVLDGPSTMPQLPATIRVYRVQTGVVEVVAFSDYVKHVLPNEWIPSWTGASLRAGAMAVKSYAWFWISRGGKQVALGADVKDNVEDQVYDPDISYASTDAAVDDTLQYAMTRGGGLFQAQYCAGSYNPDPGGDCPWASNYLTQWGSKYYSDQGKPWGWILQFYYSGAAITPSPPGGGYTGPPPVVPSATPRPQFTPTAVANAVGQGSVRADLFFQAYNRNGGDAVLGRPLGPVHWWLPYVSDKNVQVQAFSGPVGAGNVWIIYDVLHDSPSGIHNAYVLSGSFASAYAAHDPPGPEWIGPPTSDSFTAAPELGGGLAQGFQGGLLRLNGEVVQQVTVQAAFENWKTEYFVGHEITSPLNAPSFTVPGQAALVRNAVTPSIDWSLEKGLPRTYGAGGADWTVQFTRDMSLQAGSYHFQVGADSGARLWVDGLLAINGWTWRGPHDEGYNADLSSGLHTIRVQYFSLNQGAHLDFFAGPKEVSQGKSEDKTYSTPTAGAALTAHMTWLGRGKAPSPLWSLPVTLILSVPGKPAPALVRKMTTDPYGVAVFEGLPVGIYDVHVKGPHSLQSARASVSLASAATADLEMKVQVEGDVNADNCVTVDDLAVVQGMLGANSSARGFNRAADLNGDGEVTMADLSLLRSGFERCGDISADNEFSALSTTTAPSLVQALAPWLSPALLPHDLTIAAVPLLAGARFGQVFDVQIVADAGAQAIDGASFVLNFDPTVLRLVDGEGRTASGTVPGLALPSLLGNWVDPVGGSIGFAAGAPQGDAPRGTIVLTRLRFKVVGLAPSGSTTLAFRSSPSSLMQLTAGGANLLGRAVSKSIPIAR